MEEAGAAGYSRAVTDFAGVAGVRDEVLIVRDGYGIPHIRAGSAEDALRLLALADRLAYSRMIPTMRWERIVPAAEEAAPGLLARLQAEYLHCPQPGLLKQARLAVERLPG